MELIQFSEEWIKLSQLCSYVPELCCDFKQASLLSNSSSVSIVKRYLQALIFWRKKCWSNFFNLPKLASVVEHRSERPNMPQFQRLYKRMQYGIAGEILNKIHWNATLGQLKNYTIEGSEASIVNPIHYYICVVHNCLTLLCGLSQK